MKILVLLGAFMALTCCVEPKRNRPGPMKTFKVSCPNEEPRSIEARYWRKSAQDEEGATHDFCNDAPFMNVCPRDNIIASFSTQCAVMMVR